MHQQNSSRIISDGSRQPEKKQEEKHIVLPTVCPELENTQLAIRNKLAKM